MPCPTHALLPAFCYTLPPRTATPLTRSTLHYPTRACPTALPYRPHHFGHLTAVVTHTVYRWRFDPRVWLPWRTLCRTTPPPHVQVLRTVDSGGGVMPGCSLQHCRCHHIGQHPHHLPPYTQLQEELHLPAQPLRPTTPAQLQFTRSTVAGYSYMTDIPSIGREAIHLPYMPMYSGRTFTLYPYVVV